MTRTEKDMMNTVNEAIEASKRHDELMKDYEQARQWLIEETICWQHNAKKRWEQAQHYKDQWLLGCEFGYRYEREIELAEMYYKQARRNLLLL